MINRSTTRGTPSVPMAFHQVACLFGTRVAETILASVHARAHQQAEHMGASDLIKPLQKALRGGGRPHMGLALDRGYHLLGWTAPRHRVPELGL